jgi:hypothetical protein
MDPSNREQNSTPIYCSTCRSTVYLRHAAGCTDWQIPVLPTPNPPQEGGRGSTSRSAPPGGRGAMSTDHPPGRPGDRLGNAGHEPGVTGLGAVLAGEGPSLLRALPGGAVSARHRLGPLYGPAPLSPAAARHPERPALTWSPQMRPALGETHWSARYPGRGGVLDRAEATADSLR